LRARIEQARKIDGDLVTFDFEAERVEKILLKLARGHAAFELSQVRREVPSSFWWRPLSSMTEDERENFDACHVAQTFGEVGSRGLQRLLVTEVSLLSLTGEKKSIGLLINDWVEVQEDRYRYLAVDDSGAIKVKLVVAEFLACEAIWEI
jgi:hypothetical protein